jgi:uncharacterized membrane protein YphA (DoxX/SURF4 family)
MTQTITTRTVGTAPMIPTEPAAPRRSANIALWALQVVTAAVFVMAAVPKVTASPQAVEGFNAMGLGVTGMYIIGALELAGAVALLIPRLCGLAGLAFVGLMVGAVVATVLTFGPGLLAPPSVVLVLAATIAWTRRRRTADLVALVRSYAR